MGDIDPTEQLALDNGWGDVEDDEEPVAPSDIVSAVVTDTDWTTETMLSQLRRGNIKLNPRFQRRDAWDRTRKSRFIESLILGLPIPQLVLAEDKRRRGAFVVLDGKQRLLALRQFAEGSQFGGEPDASGEFRQLRLSGLDVREDLKGKTLQKLDSDAAHIDDLNAFLNQTIRTVVVRSWPNEAFLNLVFLRLNTGSVKLSPQELRQALHPGDFTDFIDDHTADSNEMQRALRITRPDFRMRDVELLLRYYSFRLYLAEYRGSLKQFLDTTTARLNKGWFANETRIRDIASEFDDSISAAFDIFGDNAYFRWQTDHFERRFNRAVFDVVMYYFSDAEIRQEARDNADDVLLAFKQLCDTNPDFVRAVQSTTKTIGATYLRLHAWGVALSEALGREIRVPTLAENRIDPGTSVS
ncbi:MAG TPA: DUF262 domain-containing protein [Kribbella sp.]|uniref:DUF262 domain-containing protein n=1 Tax=Kribbella sp. TaxID=1871183 RepID=UPI002D78D328|nr:DUF262 domain-containing protein [Kribbella sp.]HET6293296.1 DUF262 domain-containing protein [Kribbella sp.]